MILVFLLYPKMMDPKSMVGFWQLSMVFLKVQMMGKDIFPVSARMVN